MHELFEDNDIIRRVSALGLKIDVAFHEGESCKAARVGDWIGLSAKVKIDDKTVSMLKAEKMLAGVCEWICEGHDKEEALWNGRMLRKFAVGGNNSELEHSTLVGFAKEGKYKLRVAVTFGGAEGIGGGGGSVFFSSFLVVTVEVGED